MYKCKCCRKPYSIIPNINGLCSYCNKLPKFKHNYETKEILMRRDLKNTNSNLLRKLNNKLIGG